MQIKRLNIFVGTLFYKTNFSLTEKHHILFAKNFESIVCTDLLNGNNYSLMTSKQKGNVIGGYICPLDDVLKQNGYKESLDNYDINKIMNNDSKKIFIDTNILQNLDECIDVEYNRSLYENSKDIYDRFTEKVNVKKGM